MVARGLSPEEVVRAGVLLVKREGLGALGVRSLAARLDVTPMAIYRHARDGEALAASVVDAILAELPDLPEEGAWYERTERWAIASRRALAVYPGFAHHLLLHWFELPRALVVIEQLLEAFERIGLVGFEGVAAANALFTFVLMRVDLEESLRGAGALKRKLAGLDRAPVPLPRIAENAAEYEVAKVDRHFAYGLSLLLDGIERRRHRDPA